MSSVKQRLARLLAGGDPPGVPSEAGNARLLDMTQARLVFSVTAIPFVGVPFAAWLHLLGLDAAPTLAWMLGYAAAAVAIRWQRRAYLRDRALRSDAQMVARWRPVVHLTALLHGLGLALVLAPVIGRVPFDFALLLHISLAAIIAANATHQTPVLGAFQRFFICCWGVCLALVPWSFPHHWAVVLPLSLLYTFAIYRHALVAHRFFVQQVVLEDEGLLLAERYRQAKEQAEQALRAKNEFLTTASHDLRQPVHAMGFLIESIAHRNRDAALVPALEDLRRSVRSVNLMFNSLLDLSRIEGGAIGVNRSPVAIDPLLRDVCTLFREEAKSRGLALRMRPTQGRGVVFADPLLLRQALANLVHNALRYTPRGGVLLCARRRGADWRLEVWDTGIGVASAEKTRIYSAFYRHEYAWGVDSAGHGLGLAVVARCAALMGATTGLESIEGRGSRFWLRLAAAAPEAAVLPAAAVSAAPLHPLGGTCLVVEDDPQVAAAWMSLLQAWGIETRCVASAGQAFAALDEGFRPLAILCDQRLRSGESGFEVLKALFERCPDASGAMVSGEFDSDELRQAEQEGCLVLRKPLEPTQLHALLAQWLP